MGNWFSQSSNYEEILSTLDEQIRKREIEISTKRISERSFTVYFVVFSIASFSALLMVAVLRGGNILSFITAIYPFCMYGIKRIVSFVFQKLIAHNGIYF